MAFYTATSSFSLKSKILVYPVVSTANLPQLAVDLVISTLELRRVGFLDDSLLTPAVGTRENGDDGITTPLEVWGKEVIDIVLIQQRSPVLKYHKEKFGEQFVRWVVDSAFSALVLLAGVELTNRTDAQMSTATYHLVANPGRGIELPRGLDLSGIPSFVPNDEPIRMPGTGLTRRILQDPSLAKVPTVAVLRFVMEGDNREDAHDFASTVAHIAGVKIPRTGWREPQSWVGLFGRDFEQTIYG
ncbi:hypothetical protein SISSUDRAFT_278921 [Sistotremastrum suecicum HHB10207 ss-3]|uniref:Proteasome assembly chaperone 2 n=1 Tax=Sistotremastrum suecicum HHB10207 ss-3 TaxID=1314776 RepID=A0A166G8S8_9AGAM|nr:hypothetical protein SISSUDRAFT_278921 [Sistotremastrum suecicum HHB10207 ss-3]